MITGSRLLKTGISPQQLIASYEGLLIRCQQMLVCASTDNWEELIEEESRYVVEIEALAISAASITLEETLQERRMDLLERILETSLEIQHYLVLRRDALGNIIDNALRKRHLDHSYQTSPQADFAEMHDRID